MESKEQTVAWDHANDLSLAETAGKSMSFPSKHDSIEEVVKNNDDDLLNDLDQMEQKRDIVTDDSDPLAGVTNEIESMFASSETKSSPIQAVAKASESILSTSLADEMHATKTEIDFPEPSFDEQHAQDVTLKDGDVITTATEMIATPVEFTAEEFSMPPSPHNNLSHPNLLEYSDEKKENDDIASSSSIVPINEMFPTHTTTNNNNSNNSEASHKPPPRKRSKPATEKANVDAQHLNKSPKNNFKRENSGKSINSKQPPSAAAATTATAVGGGADISNEEMTNQAELLAIKAKKLADKGNNNKPSVANNAPPVTNNAAKARRKSKPDITSDDKQNNKSKEKIIPPVVLPDIITSPRKGTSMAKKKELMQQQRKRPSGEETKLPAIRGPQDAGVVGGAFSSQTPGRELHVHHDKNNNHLFDRLDQAHSSPMERSSVIQQQDDESSLSTKKKKRKPLYLRMIARARKQTHEEERQKHEQYLLFKQRRAKNNPTREEIREHMRQHDEAMKASLLAAQQQPKANHMAHVRALKKMNSFQDGDNDDQSQASLATHATAGGGGAKSRAKLRHQLETYDQIAERLDEQKKDRQRAYKKKLPPVDVAAATSSNDQQQQQSESSPPPSTGAEEGSVGGFMSPRKPSHPKMTNSSQHHARRHQQTQSQSQPQQLQSSPKASDSPDGNLSIEGHHAQQHEHEAHVPIHHPSPRKPPNSHSPRSSSNQPSPRVVTEEIQTQTDPDTFIATSSSSMIMNNVLPSSSVSKAAILEAPAVAVAVEINVLEQPLLAKDDSILPDLKADFVPYYCAPDWMDMLNKTGGGRSLSR